jgi:hypothetical protein
LPFASSYLIIIFSYIFLTDGHPNDTSSFEKYYAWYLKYCCSDSLLDITNFMDCFSAICSLPLNSLYLYLIWSLNRLWMPL